MNYSEAKAKAEKVLVTNGHEYNLAQSGFIVNEVSGSVYQTKSGKLVEVLEHSGRNNLIIKNGEEYDAVAGVWFISHIERGSFVKVS